MSTAPSPLDAVDRTANRTPSLQIGSLSADVPVVLAPMAGVTNAPFRTLCRRMGAGIYVSEMITARAYLYGNEKTLRLASFAEDETPRSIQLYGVDAEHIGGAVERLVATDHVDHIDLNFGCPAPKVTRHGGGAALPVRRRLLQSICEAAVGAAGTVPVTAKFRMGTDDDHLTYLDSGRIAEQAGISAIALHARTAHQLYSGHARWEAIATLKGHVTSIPVLGNGDIWEAADALRMMDETGCDGVVVGRGCLGRPWLFRDLAAAFTGQPVPPTPLLGEITATMIEHLDLLSEWCGAERSVREFRKHTGWYLKGFPVGRDVRRTLGELTSRDHLIDVLAQLPADAAMTEEGRLAKRGHQHGPKRVTVPEGWYELADSEAGLDAAADALVSGG